MPGFLHAVSLGVGVDYHALGQIDMLVGQEHVQKEQRLKDLHSLWPSSVPWAMIQHQHRLHSGQGHFARALYTYAALLD